MAVWAGCASDLDILPLSVLRALFLFPMSI